jgi:hypothetical protein
MSSMNVAARCSGAKCAALQRPAASRVVFPWKAATEPGDADGRGLASRVLGGAPQHDLGAALAQLFQQLRGERPQRSARHRVDQAAVHVEHPDFAHRSRPPEARAARNGRSVDR